MKPQINTENFLLLQEMNSLGRALSKTASVPDLGFHWEERLGKIFLEVPTTARVDIYDHGIWKTLHDGRKWANQGVFATEPKISWMVEFPAKFRIHFQGKRWALGPANEKLLYKQGQSARLDKREWSLLGVSLGGHVAIFALVLFIISIPSVKQAIDSSAKVQVVEQKKEQAKKAGSGVPVRSESKPFQGMTYSKFLNILAAKEFAADPAAVLMKSVGKKSEVGNNPKVSSGLGSSLGKVEGSADSGGTSLSGQLAREKFLVTESAADPAKPSKKISDQQMAQLKAKFRDLQSDFQRLYSRILLSDPNLSVTVSLELLVQNSGYLSVASFKSRGTSRSDSLEKLKSGMTEIIQGAFVGAEFSGITLRGENVFVR